MDKTTRITEGSLISVTVAAVLSGGLFTLALGIAKGNENERSITRMEAKQTQYDAQLATLNQNMAELKGIMLAKPSK